MAVCIKKNTVTMAIADRSLTMPWTQEMYALAATSERDDQSVLTYRFDNYQDASRFYTYLLTKPHFRKES